MYHVLNAAGWTDQYANLGQQTFLGTTMSLVGMTIVLLILALISTSVSLMSWLIVRRLHRTIEGKPHKKTDSTRPAPDRATSPATRPGTVLPTAGPVAMPVPGTQSLLATDDPALIAVITAAVACMLESSSARPGVAGFTIRKVRRV